MVDQTDFFARLRDRLEPTGQLDLKFFADHMRNYITATAWVVAGSYMFQNRSTDLPHWMSMPVGVLFCLAAIMLTWGNIMQLAFGLFPKGDYGLVGKAVVSLVTFAIGLVLLTLFVVMVDQGINQLLHRP
ncbi:hypothetical protein KY487_15045 [Ralstonia pseudosolanacearum]|uniref:hypothetical protein n=1 Tax=Ralstonia pseudosolanacearum TaxID=1310165 RepID=UPI001C8C98EC|nr:hypothetical protein [Ralstonia pseudosolanacearum]MBX9430578.1 hypothetical protein [Ralstonia pseudosolanacearum]